MIKGINMAEAEETLTTVSQFTELRVYSVDDIEKFSEGFLLWEASGGNESNELINKRNILIFRDLLGHYWTLNPSDRAWFVYINGDWITMSRPDEDFLEGVDEALDYLVYTDIDLDVYYETKKKKGKSSPPEKASPEAYQEMICGTYQDYIDGYLTSLSVNILLKEHMIVDKNGNLWNVGCRSGKWYQFVEETWVPSEETPSISMSPPENKHQENKRNLSLIEFYKSGAGILPEAVGDPWAPPTEFPLSKIHPVKNRKKAPVLMTETRKKRQQNIEEPDTNQCPNCNAELKPGSKFCIQCGNPVPLEKPIPIAIKCPNCSAELKIGTKFCIQCGNRISADQPG